MQIVGVDLKKLYKLMNQAIAEEWLAFYQYWAGTQIAKGMMRPTVEAELLEHAQEEYEHANKLAKRLVEIGGTPVLDPQKWSKLAKCDYLTPDGDTRSLVKQNIKAERCAIETYQELAKLTKGKDEFTYRLALEILYDEIEHEDELEAILEDMNTSR